MSSNDFDILAQETTVELNESLPTQFVVKSASISKCITQSKPEDDVSQDFLPKRKQVRAAKESDLSLLIQLNTQGILKHDAFQNQMSVFVNQSLLFYTLKMQLAAENPPLISLK